jgi:hypothetical protein
MSRRALDLIAVLLLAAPALVAQAGGHDASMAGMPMDAPDTAGPAATGVHEHMTGMLMDSPHMRMTPLAAAQPGDAARADSIVRALRLALTRYTDYKVALADGFTIFAPKVPQKVYHFSNAYSAIRSAFTFDPSLPTSLLYEKTIDGYKLVGAMYTAPRTLSLADLNARVPLSVGQWHEHINICVPPRGQGKRWLEQQDGKPLFGPKGTISTQAACDAVGGRFIPQLFGWMIHVNLWASDPKEVWGTHEHGEEH